MMSKTKADAAASAGGSQGPPRLARDAEGRIEPASLAAVIQWFLDYDERVAVVRFPAVEALFQWRQQEELKGREGAVGFNRAEDRFAVGVMQALVEHDTEAALDQGTARGARRRAADERGHRGVLRAQAVGVVFGRRGGREDSFAPRARTLS